jgi:hypothetical protein
MRLLKLPLAISLYSALLLTGCQNDLFEPQNPAAPALKDMPAVRLNYRYEADVPAPSADTVNPGEERNAAIQADFDSSRPLELLERTLSSPDKQRVLVVYHRISDTPLEYRLDLYSPDGKLIKKLTSDAMAVHFPDTIVWSPDSSSLAFVAMTRAAQPEPGTSPSPGSVLSSPTPSPEPPSPDETETPADDTNTDVPVTPAEPTPAAPTGILTFRTEQIYICNADGSGVRPVTQNEGLIYFYYAWSPGSTMLTALATSSREWRFLDLMAASKSEIMTPQGRPRIIEKNGRERRLDDNVTAVRPVWSPDSAKVATAFDTQIRIYDANGTNPTQAAIPLRNQLLISSQAYDLDQQRKLRSESDENVNAASPTPVDQLSTLPDEKLLVSYNPIVEISWPSADLLYLKTAYIRRMQNPAESAMSFARWHRLVLTPQAAQAVPTR